MCFLLIHSFTKWAIDSILYQKFKQAFYNLRLKHLKKKTMSNNRFRMDDDDF